MIFDRMTHKHSQQANIRNSSVMPILFGILVVACYGWYQYNQQYNKQFAPKPEMSRTVATQTPARHTAKAQPIVIKGLYIGMPVSTLEAVVQDKFGGDWKVIDGGLVAGHPEYHSYSITGDIESERLVSSLKADATLSTEEKEAAILTCQVDVTSNSNSGLVKQFTFWYPVVNDLFNASTLDASAFTEMFMKSYGIPQMEGKRDYWEYRKDNLAITISHRKTVSVLTIIPSSEVQKFQLVGQCSYNY